MATKLIVTGLSDEFTEACLYDLFDLYGAIVDIAIPTDPGDGRLLGLGHVTFEREVDAARARLSMDGAEICGRTIHVREADAAYPATPPPAEEPADWGDGAFN